MSSGTAESSSPGWGVPRLGEFMRAAWQVQIVGDLLQRQREAYFFTSPFHHLQQESDMPPTVPPGAQATFKRLFLTMNPAEDHNIAFADRKCTALPGYQKDMHRGMFKVAGELNDWLVANKFDGRFEYVSFNLFALVSTNVDIGRLVHHLHLLPWNHPEDVQLFVKDVVDSRYSLWELKIEYFREAQEFLASADAKKPDIRRMIEDAIFLGDGQAPVERRIRRDLNERAGQHSEPGGASA